MACNYARSFVSSATRVLKVSTRNIVRGRQCILFSGNGVNTNTTWLQRGFTRSHWVLCGEKNLPGAVSMGMNTTCTCNRIHTEVDKELAAFLEKEINLEKETSKKRGGLPKLQNFDVKTNGANVTLNGTFSDEKITIKFNINDSVDADGAMDEDVSSDQPEIPNMVSKPPFIVEINKGGKRTLSLQCSFTPPEGADAEQTTAENEEAIVDSFEINEVALHEGEWEEEVYSLHSDVMDGNLYDLLMDMLDERGISEDFVNQMVEYATAYEHGKYVQFLEGLQSFTKGN